MVGSGWIFCFGFWPLIGRLTVRYRVQMNFGDPVSGFAKIVKKLFRSRRLGKRIGAEACRRIGVDGRRAYQSGSVSAGRRGRGSTSSIGWAGGSDYRGGRVEISRRRGNAVSPPRAECGKMPVEFCYRSKAVTVWAMALLLAKPIIASMP
jgi:hypothetical protein